MLGATLGLGLVAAPPLAAGTRQADPAVVLPEGQRELDRAVARARRELPGFLALLDQPPKGAHDFMVRYPLTRQDQVWLGELQRDGTGLVGTLLNQPQGTAHRRGERVRIAIGRISDWTYRDASGVSQGAFTTRALLPFMPPAEAAQARAANGWAPLPAF